MIRRHAVVRGWAVAIFAVPCAYAGGQQVFHGSVDLVTAYVSVTAHNRPVDGLGAPDFAITDNGVPQEIVDVGHDEVPIDVTLIVDMTGGWVDTSALAAGVNRLSATLRPGDRARIVTFDRTVREDVPLTPASDVPKFQVQPGIHDALALSPLAACYDALVVSLVTPPVRDRRELAILFSAGRDAASLLPASAALDVARRSSTAVFTVRTVFDPKPISRPPEGATPLDPPDSWRHFAEDPVLIPASFFHELTEITGGRAQDVQPTQVLRNDSQDVAVRVTTGKDLLQNAFVRALDDFRSTYVVRYTLHGVPLAGWHALKIRVTKSGSYDVRARTGYEG